MAARHRQILAERKAKRSTQRQPAPPACPEPPPVRQPRAMPDDTPNPHAAVMTDPRQLKPDDRVIYRENGTGPEIYPTVAQVLAHPDRVTLKLEHPSWLTYRFTDCGRTVMVIPATH